MDESIRARIRVFQERLRDARRLHAAVAGRAVGDSSVSLVRYEDSVGVTECSFVAWISFRNRTGRVIRLDDQNRAITIVGYKDLVMDFTLGEIIIGDAPIPRMKCRPHERFAVAGWCLLLRERELKLA